jgi:hypothetical protein
MMDFRMSGVCHTVQNTHSNATLEINYNDIHNRFRCRGFLNYEIKQQSPLREQLAERRPPARCKLLIASNL